jgi:hypothetical protein
MMAQFYREQRSRLPLFRPRLRGTMLGFVVLLLWCMTVALGVFVVGLVWFSGPYVAGG